MVLGINDKNGNPCLRNTARLAYELTTQKWEVLGLSEARVCKEEENKLSSSSSSPSFASVIPYSKEVSVLAERILALLLIRVIAILSVRNQNATGRRASDATNRSSSMASNSTVASTFSGRSSFHSWKGRDRNVMIFGDLSTTTICCTLLSIPPSNQDDEYSDADDDPDGNQNGNNGNGNNDDFDINDIGLEDFKCEWPTEMTKEFIEQLRNYITTILTFYRSVPYHNAQHAFHVFCSSNKLLDLMLCEQNWSVKYSNPTPNTNKEASHPNDNDPSGNDTYDPSDNDTNTHIDTTTTDTPIPNIHITPITKKVQRPTYGLKSEPLRHLSFLFSALVHDVDHTGINNRQLVLECDPLAMLYNDQSVAEQRSLAVAFSLLVEAKYATLRAVIFGTKDQQYRQNFMTFRKSVIDLVLSTDIGSPERVQIVKSRWKEAFGDVTKRAAAARKREAILAKAAAAQKKKDTKAFDKRKLLLERQWKSSYEMLTVSDVDTSDKDQEQWISQPADRKYADTMQTNNLRDRFFNSRGSMGFPCLQPEEEEDYKRDTSTPEDDDNDVVDPYGDTVADSPYSSEVSVSVAQTFYGDTVTGDDDDDDDDHDENDGVILEGVTLGSSILVKDIPDDDLVPFSSETSDAEPKSMQQQRRDTTHRIHQKDDTQKTGGDDTNTKKNENTNTTKNCKQKPQSKRGTIARRRKSNEQQSKNTNSDGTGQVTGERQRQKELRRTSSKSFRRDSGDSLRSSRRFSAPAIVKPRPCSYRLGIRRALDLTGNAIEPFSRKKSEESRSNSLSTRESSDRLHGSSRNLDNYDLELDEPDELMATVVLEQMIQAADVSALLQGWDNMLKWSGKLFREQKACFVAGRGDDPAFGWYENQITFFQSYALPLANRLAEMAIFEKEVGEIFANGVELNKRRWMLEGIDVTSKLVFDWEKKNQKRRSSGS